MSIGWAGLEEAWTRTFPRGHRAYQLLVLIKVFFHGPASSDSPHPEVVQIVSWIDLVPSIGTEKPEEFWAVIWG